LLDFSIFSCIGHVNDLAFNESLISAQSDGIFSANSIIELGFDIRKKSSNLQYRLEKAKGYSCQELTISRHNDETHFTAQARKSFKFRACRSGDSSAIPPRVGVRVL